MRQTQLVNISLYLQGVAVFVNILFYLQGVPSKLHLVNKIIYSQVVFDPFYLSL